MRLAGPTDLAEPGAAGSRDGACQASHSDTLAPRNLRECTRERTGMHVNVQGNVEALNSTTHNERVWGHAPRDLDVDPSSENENICNEDFENAYEIVSEFGSNDNTYNYSEEEDSENFGDNGNDMSIKNLYHNWTWNQKFNIYNPGLQDFVSASGCSIQWPYFPSFIVLFQLFWLHFVLQRIADETNQYAIAINNNEGTFGGCNWKPITLSKLMVFIAIILYTGMKRQPNLKSYWYRRGSIFHCEKISNLMTRARFMLLTRCLHVINLAAYVRDRNRPGYDKMGQVRWLINVIWEKCMETWNVGQFATVDKMMIRYKGTYCPACHYMPQKPQKWGLKVWCLADAKSKYVANFEVYCGKDPIVKEEIRRPRGEVWLAYNVVLRLVSPYKGKRHVITMDKLFLLFNCSRNYWRGGPMQLALYDVIEHASRMC